jgi:hypothetical protein
MTTPNEVKAHVLDALLALGAEVTLGQDVYGGRIKTVNGHIPRWEIRIDRGVYRRGIERVSHINVGRGPVNRGMRIIRPKGDTFDFIAIAQAIVADVTRQASAAKESEAVARENAAARTREDANTEAVERIVADSGGAPTAFRTAHCKLSGRSWGIVIETTAQTEDEARAVVATIERTMRELRPTQPAVSSQAVTFKLKPRGTASGICRELDCPRLWTGFGFCDEHRAALNTALAEALPPKPARRPR